MDIRDRLLHLAVVLSIKGYHEEARDLRKVSRSASEEGGDVPFFFRHNHDYGESLFHGNMIEKIPTAEWLKQHRRKGPNFPQKKAK